jgi:hypothetical protein
MAKINSGLLEDLRRDLLPPTEPGDLLNDRPVGAAMKTRPASSLFFQALNELIRSKPDQGTFTLGSLFLAWSASVTVRKHWL